MSDPVVHLKDFENGIVQVTMEDRIHKNTFSDELIRGLQDCFEKIKQNSSYKAVVLTGYDNYFCTGGTKETLLKLQEGKSVFTDTNIYRLPMECEIPVIAAMQGHGIGGGFSLGLFADVIILSRESIYNANFMKYGFTPGFGATYILPQKLGFSLAEELMLTAENYRGADLEKRGVPFTVLSKTEVLSRAYQIAEQLADKTRLSLITLKKHLVTPIQEQLNKVIEQELLMHRVTFHQDTVKERINQYFG
jgi:polyketide biosynthesis enoyl-CoA hydratase PksI